MQYSTLFHSSPTCNIALYSDIVALLQALRIPTPRSSFQHPKGRKPRVNTLNMLLELMSKFSRFSPRFQFNMFHIMFEISLQILKSFVLFSQDRPIRVF